MKRIIAFISIWVLLLSGSAGTVSSQERDSSGQEYAEARIIKIQSERVPQGQVEMVRQSLKIEILSGRNKGKQVETLNVIPDVRKGIQHQRGDVVIVTMSEGPDGELQVIITDFERKKPLAVLFLLFLVLVFVVSRRQGLLSFASMVLSFLIIIFYLIPRILAGDNPALASMIATLGIAPLTFFLSHGFSRKTSVALVGTVITIGLAIVMATLAIYFVKLTGYADEQAAFLQLMGGQSIDLRNLLLAGIIIGSLGVLDDITISQAAIVERLYQANPKYSFTKLYQETMSVGNDHIASIVNTLILVYAGAALPLFLIFSNTTLSFGLAINSEIVATEIVRTLIGSISLVVSVPLTTFLACLAIRK